MCLKRENKLVELYFSEEVKELLLKLKAERKKQHINDYGWVFYTNKSTIEKPISKSTLNEWAHIAGSLIGIDTIHPHDFRHSGATLLKNAGMPLEYVSALLSHSSTETTKKYYLKDDTRLISQLKDQYSF